MSNYTNQKKFKFKHFLFLCFIILIITFIVYINNFYKADTSIISDINYKNYVKKIIDDNENIIYLSDSNSETAFILYPGGKVEYSAYEALASVCADYGITTFIVKMPFNLAVFNPNAALKVIENYPDIKNWYIGGHSLGGSMAASFASSHQDKIKGLILLASYSTNKLNSTKVLSIYGSNDNILNLDKYKKYKENINHNLSEHIINGGNHANFGNYGFQNGDGKSTISNINQITSTAQIIFDFIF